MGLLHSHHDESEDDSSDEESGGSHSSSAGSSSGGSDSEDTEKGERCFLFPCARSSQARNLGNLDFVSSSHVKAQTRTKLLLADNRHKAVQDYFVLDQKSMLGEGGFASVVVGQNRISGDRRAIKTIMKASSSAEKAKVKMEIDAMARCDHPNIVKFFQSFEDEDCYYLVLEICEGKELFDRIVEEKSFSEPLAATVMQQIFRATAYIHNAGVCHRDIKPENFLFQTAAPVLKNTLKMIDFGIAKLFDPPKAAFKTKVGTPQYVAPEVLGQFFRYGVECDVWSCGVVMYVLLAGALPFPGRNDHEVLQKVKAAQPNLHSSKWTDISEAAKELIRKLLKKEPTRRLTATQALQEGWVQETAAKRPNAPILPAHISRLKAFTIQNKLKKVALSLVARHMNSEEIDNLRTLFIQLDVNGDGLLSTDELRQGLMGCNIPGFGEEQLQELMAGVDADGSGEIDYTEFLAATIEHQSVMQEAVCRAAFRVFDKDDDGFISPEELREALQSQSVVDSFGKDNTAALMSEVDVNGDGQIDFQEFMALMRQQ
eukprot:TRINITY_DN1867_c0_g1_i1.p1 TRINITY_DN1867_c0_g1~~TRINITY_DN1867_c0_g1_i1.p1  ORF type:complete len:543 (-),score=174.27 TRINITY_DN1867_c0_g1_i1:351-1979(-)